MADSVIPQNRREQSLNIRITSIQKQTIERAARLQAKTVTSFVVDHAYDAARKVIQEDESLFRNDEDWRNFCQQMDRPGKVLPGLRQVLLDPLPDGI